MSRRREMVVCGGLALPYDAEVEYLEGVTGAYIDTGFYADHECVFDTKVAQTKNDENIIYWGCRNSGGPSEYNKQCYLNSNSTGSGNPNIVLYSTSTTSYDNWDSGIVPTLYTMYSLTDITCVSTMNDMIYPVQLFSFIAAGVRNTTAGTCRIGLWRVRKNGATLVDMIPVRVGTVGYMYDRVSKQLFGNGGTGAFAVGPDVSAANGGGIS